MKNNEESNETINQGFRIKRIAKEINFYINFPHPFIEIFPTTTDISFWRIIMKGPEDTPYEKGLFLLYISFPENYPQEPPKLRFLTQV